MAGKPAFDKSSDSACATPDKSAGKFWFGRREKTMSLSKTVAVPITDYR
jgi:hypothetical protein